jgi:hypothetical protein
LTEINVFQIGDIVRIKEPISLVPLDESIPSEIPAGIFGEVINVTETGDGGIAYLVEFHEPYEFASEIAIHAHMLELMFRFWLN